jgi:hypothetical protein
MWHVLLTASISVAQVHSAFQLTSVAAVAAVAATRQPWKPTAAAPRRQSASPRDLLVLHQDGQLAVYTGKQRVADVTMQLPPGFPAALGSRHAGEAAALPAVPCLLLTLPGGCLQPSGYCAFLFHQTMIVEPALVSQAMRPSR